MRFAVPKSAFARLVSACAAIALLATAFFLLLHHVGNQLPYDLAAQRFKAQAESGRPDEGHAKGYKSKYEYCEISAAVLAGARRTDEQEHLRDAVLVRQLKPVFGRDVQGRCKALEAAANGAVIEEKPLRPRSWWGSKALYAIALRYASVQRIRELTEIATRVAYGLLAVSLLLLAPKMLLLATPLLVFGVFFSGIDYWADVANGFPYLWTVLFAAGLALLTRRGETATVPIYCFAAGTVSSFLWLGDGHTFLAVAWIGMVVWFGCGTRNMAERTGRAVSCVVCYGAGIVVCYALGQAVKALFLGSRVVSVFWQGLVRTVEDSGSGSWYWMSAPDEMSVPTYLDSYYAMAWPDWLPADFVPTFVAVFSLAASIGLGVFEARRGRPDLLWGVVWIVGLISATSLTFLIVEHQHYRTARFAFVPLALCLTCLVLSVCAVDWRNRRRSLAAMWEVPVLLVAAGCISWYLARFELSATAKLIEGVKDMQPRVSSTFDVYLDGNLLVYVNEECGDEDDDAPFFLHLYPVVVADLPAGRQQYGFDNLDFDFRRNGRRDGGRCAAARALPDYGMVAIHTGQYLPEKGHVWSERIDLEEL